MFSLSYLSSAERLTVVIAKARNLKHPEQSKVIGKPLLVVVKYKYITFKESETDDSMKNMHHVVKIPTCYLLSLYIKHGRLEHFKSMLNLDRLSRPCFCIINAKCHDILVVYFQFTFY